jgi:hypothetical protein
VRASAQGPTQRGAALGAQVVDDRR